MSKKMPRFLMEEKTLCPRCGEKRGVRGGVRGGKQRYICRACGRYFQGETPTPPERACPYCRGHCLKRGVRLAKAPGWRLTPLDRWLGFEPPAPRRAQEYICTQCGKMNTDLWPPLHPTGKAWGPCRFCTDILLDARAEHTLLVYCLKHKVQPCEAMRTIFREASYAKFAVPSRVFGKPPTLPPDTPMPPLSNGQIKSAERRRGKRFGYREIVIVRRFNLKLDAVSYRGLKRTMEANDMTRQEAARWLIIGREGGFVGCLVGRGEE